MRIVIMGGGRVGFVIADQLTKEGHDIVLVDNDKEVVQQLSDSLDIMVMCGNGAALDVQRAADVAHSDLLIAVTPSDELNMVCCVLAKKLGCPNTICRVRNPEYSEQAYLMSQEMGLSMIINPEWMAAREMFRLMQIPGFLKRDSFAKGRVEIVELIIKEGSPFAGATLMELPKRLNLRILVCAIERDGEALIPSGNVRLQIDDKIYVSAATAELAKLMETIGQRERKTKNAMLIGGGRTARYLAEMLIKTGTRVKIIEKQRDVCLALAEQLPKATVVHGNGASQALLRAENIELMDTVVTMTDIDEQNLILSLFADHVGVRQIITKVDSTEHNELLHGKGFDCVLNPKPICAQAIIHYVRCMQNTDGSTVQTVHYLVDGKVEALEFRVVEEAAYLHKPLRELKLKEGLLIACINRLGETLIPSGNDTIEIDDTVVVVSKANHHIANLRDMFVREN